MAKYFNRLLIILLACSTWVLQAKPISISINELKANGELIESEDKEQPFFVILHGTFGWHGMEITKTLQQMLGDEGYGSIAFSLTLGESNRSGFFDCSHLIISHHQDAQTEIDRWVKKANQLGYKNVALIGHSRGGAQVASYLVNHSKNIHSAYLLAPMTWVKSDINKHYNPTLKASLNQLITKAKATPEKPLKNLPVLHCKNAEATSSAFISYYDESPQKNTPSLLEKISLPTMVFLGEQDSLTLDFLKQKSLLKSNTQVSIKMIEDADHFFRDFAAEDVVSHIVDQVSE